MVGIEIRKLYGRKRLPKWKTDGVVEDKLDYFWHLKSFVVAAERPAFVELNGQPWPKNCSKQDTKSNVNWLKSLCLKNKTLK